MESTKSLPIGQGHGIKGRFAGLPDPYGSEEFAQVVILPVAFDKTTTYGKGTEKGPECLIEASRNLELYDIETNSEVYLKGVFTAKSIAAKTSEEMLEAVYQKAKEYLIKGKFVVTLGGEHSITYAPVKAYAEHYGKITVLQFDAHADLQPAYENNPWSHASAMSRVNDIPQVEKLVSVGIRSMSVEEKPFVKEDLMFYAHALDNNDLWIEKVLHQLEGPIYITFDLDAFDSGLMPSTGTPEPGGLSWRQATKILKRVFEEKQVVGFDVVELLPLKDFNAPDFLAAKLVYKLLSYQFSKEH